MKLSRRACSQLLLLRLAAGEGAARTHNLHKHKAVHHQKHHKHKHDKTHHGSGGPSKKGKDVVPVLTAAKLKWWQSAQHYSVAEQMAIDVGLLPEALATAFPAQEGWLQEKQDLVLGDTVRIPQDEEYVHPYMMTTSVSADFECATSDSTCKDTTVTALKGKSRAPLYIDTIRLDSAFGNYGAYDQCKVFGQVCITAPYQPGVNQEDGALAQVKDPTVSMAVFPICMYSQPAATGEKAWWQVQFAAGPVQVTRLRLAFNAFAEVVKGTFSEGPAYGAKVTLGVAPIDDNAVGKIIDFDMGTTGTKPSNSVWYSGFYTLGTNQGVYELTYTGDELKVSDTVKIIAAAPDKQMSLCGFQAFIKKIPEVKFDGLPEDWTKQGTISTNPFAFDSETVVTHMDLYPQVSSVLTEASSGRQLYYDGLKGVTLRDEASNILAEYRGRVDEGETHVSMHLLHKVKNLTFADIAAGSGVNIEKIDVYVDGRAKCDTLTVSSCGTAENGATANVLVDAANSTVCPSSYELLDGTIATCGPEDAPFCCTSPEICQENDDAAAEMFGDWDNATKTLAYMSTAVCAGETCKDSDKDACVVPRQKCSEGVTADICADIGVNVLSPQKPYFTVNVANADEYCTAEECLMSYKNKLYHFNYPGDSADIATCCVEYTEVETTIQTTLGGEESDLTDDLKQDLCSALVNTTADYLDVVKDRVICKSIDVVTSSSLLQLAKEMRKGGVTVVSAEGEARRTQQKRRRDYSIEAVLAILTPPTDVDAVKAKLASSFLLEKGRGQDEHVDLIRRLHHQKKQSGGLTASLSACSTLASLGVTGVSAAPTTACADGSDPPIVNASMNAMLNTITYDLAQSNFTIYEEIVCSNKHAEVVKAALKAVGEKLASL